MPDIESDLERKVSDEQGNGFSAGSTPPPRPEQLKRKKTPIAFFALAIVAIVFLGIFMVNELKISGPVKKALSGDERNKIITVKAHYYHYINFHNIVLDLQRVEDATTADLLRGVFIMATALHKEGDIFERVVFASRGKPMFFMEGVEFDNIGIEFDAGQNPLYLARTFPEKLYLPNGEPAYGKWEGGVLAVVTQQMNDLSDFAECWVSGETNNSK